MWKLLNHYLSRSWIFKIVSWCNTFLEQELFKHVVAVYIQQGDLLFHFGDCGQVLFVGMSGEVEWRWKEKDGAIIKQEMWWFGRISKINDYSNEMSNIISLLICLFVNVQIDNDSHSYEISSNDLLFHIWNWWNEWISIYLNISHHILSFLLIKIK